ncbi:MAG: SDR family oxidoreductase [Thermosipho sp. (in: Bacteria)]|nr:SDR family oxidoreductase [Thermosipho sp. (in: thermotogales)]
MPVFLKNETVLITGGSSGIGEEFAYQLAEKGLNLIIVGRNSERLEKVYKNTKRINEKISVEIINFDLSQDIDLFIDTIKFFDIDHLINNAGFGLYGKFVNGNINLYNKMISVNIKALTLLSYFYSKKFIEKNKGGIINVASVAGFFPIPHFAVYGSTKSYVYNFSMSLWAELRKFNVHVMCLAPGKTKTRFFERANMKNNQKLMSVKDVVYGAIKAYEKNKPLYIPGISNKLTYHLIRRIFSDKFVAKLLEKTF